jgi:hypothetical protein
MRSIGGVGMTCALLFTAAGLWASGSSGKPNSGHGHPGDRGAHHTCDQLDPSVCLYPWPNDYFTLRDRDTDTGRRLDLDPSSTPQNASGKHIDVSDLNRNDGFSPGSPISTRVPGLDTQQALQNTGAPTLNDLQRSFSRHQAIVLINARTHKRQLIWAEVDALASDPAHAALEIHPAVNLDEGGHYIVALRHLRDSSDHKLQPRGYFRALRDHLLPGNPVLRERRKHFRWIFKTLKRSHIKRGNLYLAWDFTVASERNLSERALHIRNDALAQLGDRTPGDRVVQGRAPAFQIGQVTDFAPCGSDGCQEGESDRLLRRVAGTYTVPCYLDQPGCPPGSRFLHSPADNPIPTRLPGNTMQANFVCNIPRGAAAEPGRPLLYGHGLFGDATEVDSSSRVDLAAEHDFVMCATDWVGMAEGDVGNAIRVLQDLSNFPTIPDRMQQAYVNFIYLGRLLDNDSGFVTNPAFRLSGAPLVDTSHLYYDGGSQGGIEGGALTALSPDFTRAALGVPGMNYSIMLPRSVDFDEFAAFLYPSYPNELERPLIFSLLQNLWDRGDADGYAHHMTGDPLPDTPRHKVILDEAFGDHQVPNAATEVEARTIGARLREPDLDPGRSTATHPFFGIPRIQGFPFNGSLLEVWDVGPLRTVNGVVKGTPPPPITNTPNRLGVDPHGPDASEQMTARQQISEFLQPNRLSRIIDVCGPSPCYLDGYTGPGP